jgi:hypothetical protein
VCFGEEAKTRKCASDDVRRLNTANTVFLASTKQLLDLQDGFDFEPVDVRALAISTVAFDFSFSTACSLSYSRYYPVVTKAAYHIALESRFLELTKDATELRRQSSLSICGGTGS